MNRDQAEIAVPFLNTYAHGYLGLARDKIIVVGIEHAGVWSLLVATLDSTTPAADLDEAKALIDVLAKEKTAQNGDNHG